MTIATTTLKSLAPRPLAEMTDGELRNAFWEAVGLSALAIRQAAQIWCAMEDRGMDLSGVRLAIRGYFRRVVEGSVLPEVIAKFAGMQLLRKVASLPVAEQRRLIDDGSVPVVVRSGEKYTDYRMSLTDLRNGLVAQVFGDGFVRDVPAQIAYIEGSKPAAWVPTRPILGGKVKIDRAAGTVRVGKTIVAAQDMIDALRENGMI